jgi:hypothetical protein
MKYKTLIMSAVFVMATVPVYAQTKTPVPSAKVTETATPSATLSPTTTEDKDVQDLKENIATKVAELRKKGLKATAGVITGVKGTEVTIKNNLDATYTVKIDETLTKVYQITDTSKKEIKQSDLKKDMYIIVSGPLIEKTITANVIYFDEQIFVGSGKITEVNTDDVLIKVTTTERDNLTLDIPARLKLQIVNSKTLDIESTTLSKIKEGDTVHFIYAKTGAEKQASRFDALKIVVIPQEFFEGVQPTATPEPTTKASPSPTAKLSPTKAVSPSTKVTPSPTKKTQ